MRCDNTGLKAMHHIYLQKMMAFLRKCCGATNTNGSGSGSESKYGFNTMAPEVQENTDKLVQMFQDKIDANGFPLQVHAKYTRSKGIYKNIIIEPTLDFYKLIASPNTDSEYMKIVNYNETKNTHDYPKLVNHIELDINNDKIQITCVKVQVTLNSQAYTIQHSIIVTWLFAEFINRMGLTYCPPGDFNPPQHEKWPIWGLPRYCVPDPIHFEKGRYSYEQYITEQARNECIMTINMAKASSQNLYSYLPRIDSSSTESEIFDFWATKK